MSAIFIVFPPGGGGNHLRNIISSGYTTDDHLAKLYNGHKTVHSTVGSNLQHTQIENATLHQDQVHLLHGHFGEIMSFQQQVRNIANKKFVIVSPDTIDDRKLLNIRRKTLGHCTNTDGNYFDSEQVFLYEPFMYYWYFQTPMKNIMNISILEWFTRDIDNVLDRLSYFLDLKLDKEQVNSIHLNWIKANKL